MGIGIFEIGLAALVFIIGLIWWLWPRNDRGDLTAPPAHMTGTESDHVSQPHDSVHKTEPVEVEETASAPPSPPRIAPRARRGDVTSEADYSEEELMIRDVRALLHRERKIEAIKRARQTLSCDLKEALEFVESLNMPGGLDQIRYRDGRIKS